MANLDVFRELDNLRREIDEAFRGFGATRRAGSPILSPVAARRFPLINMSEDETNLYIDALLPGVDPSAVDLSILRNTLSVTGERRAPTDEKGQVFHRSEIGFGKFARTIELPMDVDSEKIHAEYRDGIMHITVAKPEHAKPKRIDIKLG